MTVWRSEQHQKNQHPNYSHRSINFGRKWVVGGDAGGPEGMEGWSLAFAVKLHLRTPTLSQHYVAWLYGFRNTSKSSGAWMIVAAASLPVEICLFVVVPVAPKPLR